jgi:DNA-nicking Smr family endonuclease
VEIEARLDLHGMRQAEAHRALRNFLLRCHDSGRRWVLVITGKGVSERSNRADRDDGFLEREERGTLRRNVPLWLSEPELRSIIISTSSAAPQHGGDGALYVYLRKRIDRR